MIVTGSCFCGSIAYKIEGELRDGKSCHCQQCRKAFSSQASAYATVDPEQFSWTEGEQYLTSYESQKTSDGLLFCSKCGSTLCGTSAGEVSGVTLGCVNGNPDVSIGMHIFVGSKAAWEVMPDNVIQYEEGPPV